MNPLTLTIREIAHRWKSSLIVVLLVAAITATLAFFSVNRPGFQREISRNARDIGSNVVILPTDVDQFQYHTDGGYSNVTMPVAMVQQLIEFKASLNHLIPMLERKSEIKHGETSATARIVGITASIPMPGRPKSPMQKSIGEHQIQLGSELARKLGIERNDSTTIEIRGVSFEVQRVNRENGTWQDAAAFIDLKTAQTVFELPEQISRIEAIECTDERCAETGLKSDVVLASELAQITDQALLLRREKIATARSGIRTISQANLKILENVLWGLLAAGVIGLSGLNSFLRQSEIGVLQSLGYGQARVVSMFVLRSIFLAATGSAIGIITGATSAWYVSQPLFLETGKKFSIAWPEMLTLGLIAIFLAAIASSVPAMLAAMRHPADIIGKDG